MRSGLRRFWSWSALGTVRVGWATERTGCPSQVPIRRDAGFEGSERACITSTIVSAGTGALSLVPSSDPRLSPGQKGAERAQDRPERAGTPSISPQFPPPLGLQEQRPKALVCPVLG